MKMLADELINFCNLTTAHSESKLSLRQSCPRILKVANTACLIPTQRALTANFPSKGESLDNFQPFPSNCPVLQGFQDSVTIMPSLQRPKRLILLGSDGKNYPFLCKPKDDLRKDARLMEFHSLVCKFLQKDGETRKRQLKIRTYAVIPLNEECGLIEWVSNTVGLRNIVRNLWLYRGIKIDVIL